MKIHTLLVRLSVVVLAVCLIVVQPQHVDAARIDDVNKASQFSNDFKVVAKQVRDAIRVTVTVPKVMHGHELGSVSLYSQGQTKVTTNGTELEFLIDADEYEQAVIHAGYSDPNHNPEETGGYWAFRIDISDLAGELK